MGGDASMTAQGNCRVQEEGGQVKGGGRLQYALGQKVWVSTRDSHMATKGKLAVKYEGPYTVKERINEVTYWRTVPQPTRIRPWTGGPSIQGEGPTQFPQESLVDWEGYGPEERSWIPASQILDPGLIATFHRLHPQRSAPRRQSRPCSSWLADPLGGGSVMSKAIFDHPHEGRECGERLTKLHQGTRAVSDHAHEFHTIAAGSEWNKAALLFTFRNGLNMEALHELACRDDELDLDQLITQAIRLDRFIRERRPCRTSVQPTFFPWDGTPTDLLAVDHWFHNSARTQEEGHVQLRHAIRSQQRFANCHGHPTPSFHPGQKVLVSTQNMRLGLSCRKLSSRYISPFKPLHYSAFSSNSVPVTPPAPLDIEDQPAYLVQEILDSHRHQGQLQHLIDWEGYGPEERSWELPRNILDPSFIADFYTSHPDCLGPMGQGRPRGTRIRSSGATRQTGDSVMVSVLPTSLSPPRCRSPSPEY
ncbi:hypothetical protein P4O66_000863 [Electrophorus voltai]|uniref:Chromo domain-containing protein n=1 Tax=Electrophorus voltai TaxID=2609070 RepID=A0AAD8ZGD7_9TELE|nr:hypothetical protein P4O66_000863 [Electrophorus voltai]